jgi:diadenosine tetraphosphate (Ap4A) HIT family hydrolase
MRPLDLSEIADLARYAELRDAYRRAVIDHKQRRRMALGEKATLVFEDRETLRFQVQEMLWIERIADPGKVQAEIDVYNELMPGERELSATLFIEITELAEVRPALDRLIGLDEHLNLVLGQGDHEDVIPARFDPKQVEEDRLAAVQYIRFSLDPRQAGRLADPAQPAAIRTDHPNYRRLAPLPATVRESLAADLVREPEPLLSVASSAVREGALEDGLRATHEREILRTARTRAFVPPNPASPGHCIVEPVPPVASLLVAEADLLAELIETLRAVADQVVRAHGACRIELDVTPTGEGLRWHVYALEHGDAT